MTIDEFKTGLVKYYGEHQSGHVTKVTLKYVESNFDKAKYPALMQEIMKSHPFNYGFPDVAAIESAHDRYFKKDGKSIRKTKISTETWQSDIKPLSDDERKQAESNRNKWKDLVADASKANKVKQDDKCQLCNHKTETGENYFCRGCINHNKFEELK